MTLKIKRVDRSIPLPEFKTPGAAALDLHVREDTTIAPGEATRIPLNEIVKLPKGYFSLLVSRSSTYKRGLTPANGIGVIDNDYCGEDDSLSFTVINYTKEPVHVVKGDRLAQLIICKSDKPNKILEVAHMDAKSRGGFGTTGK